MKKKAIRIPQYSLSEELINSISHGIGAGLAIAGLVLMILKAKTAEQIALVSIFGSTMIILYLMSCIYHALSPKTKGKKVLRVLDHCNVYLLVLGTYIPIVLLGVKGPLGWILFGIVTGITLIGIIFTATDIDKFSFISVVCHLLNGWSILFAIPALMQNMGLNGIIYIVLGGIMYSLGAILYWIGAHKKYMHSIFHFFCLAGTLFHFLVVYFYLLN
jgi:hemolysin III